MQLVEKAAGTESQKMQNTPELINTLAKLRLARIKTGIQAPTCASLGSAQSRNSIADTESGLVRRSSLRELSDGMARIGECPFAPACT